MTPTEIINRVLNDGDGWYWVRVTLDKQAETRMAFAHIGYVRRPKTQVVVLQVYDELGEVDHDLVYGTGNEPSVVVHEMKELQEPF